MFSFFANAKAKNGCLNAAIIIMVLFAAAACSRTTETPQVQTASRTNRIISAAPSNTEIIAGLGMADRLIAVDVYSGAIPGLPSGIMEIDFFYPDAEAIIGLNPDIIIMNDINSYGVADNPFRLLGDLGIKVVQIPFSVSIEGIYGDIMTIARELGAEDRGEALIQSMRAEIESITAQRNAPVKSVYFEIEPPPFVYSFGQGTFLNEMIEISGGRNIFSDQTGWFSPSAEEIISRNPDIIFTTAYTGDDPVAEIMNREFFENITAVKENRVYAIDADSASRASQNIMPALRQMTQAISAP